MVDSFKVVADNSRLPSYERKELQISNNKRREDKKTHEP